MKTTNTKYYEIPQVDLIILHSEDILTSSAFDGDSHDFDPENNDSLIDF